MSADRELPRGDRADEPEPGPPGETFSQKLRRLAHELHRTPLDAQPGKPMPAAYRKGLQGDARTDAILEGRDPDTREPGSDDQ